jgi:outer membrane protein assembly factor BamD
MKMLAFPIRWRPLAAMALATALACAFSPSAYGQKPKITKAKPQKSTPASPSVEPDKVLYDRAMDDIKHSKFIEARLNLQTLINTYPDSEYLAKAKLAVADSYYKEGGTSNLTQSIDEYKNFIVFFPFLDEAAYAQMQVAMAHYRMMEKADRDNSQAQNAETEFQIFLQKYPTSALRPQAEQYLRNAQEVIADGEFRIGRFYYVRARTNPADYPAAAARLVEVSERYPLYSQADDALWMLSSIYERAKKYSKNEDDKNHWGDLAAKCYDRIVTEYPLSKLAPDAKARLQGMGMPVPRADPEALARMQKDVDWQKQHHSNAVLSAMSAFKTGPDVVEAARAGAPNPNPPDDAVSATEVLKQGAVGPSFGLDAQQPAGGDSSESAPANVIEGPTSPADSSGGAPTTGVGAEIIEAPSGPAPAAASDTTTTAAISNVGSSGSGTGTADPATAAPPAAIVEQPAASPSVPEGATSVGPTATTAIAGGGSSSSSSQPAAKASTAPAANSSTESTSKKKKGLHKLIPF